MAADTRYPTQHPEVNAVLDDLLSSVQTTLGENFVGLYLYGSLAAGDFDLQSSDIDFVVATATAIPDTGIAELAGLHQRLAAGQSKWGCELEGAYVPRQALRRYLGSPALLPRVWRYGRLAMEPERSTSMIQRYMLRESGVVVAGPPPHTLIDPVLPDDLRRAVLENLSEWWAPMLENPARLHQPGYQPFAVLTMCRMLYTLEHGTIVSKPTAARWAQVTLGNRWAALIDRAISLRLESRSELPEETVAFIRQTVEHSQQYICPTKQHG